VVIGVRSSLTDPSPDFMIADAMYIAAPGREFANASNIDTAGVKVGVSRGGGSDQFLTEALKSAQVVRVPGGVSNAISALRDGRVDVWAAKSCHAPGDWKTHCLVQGLFLCMDDRSLRGVPTVRTIRRRSWHAC